MPFGYCLGRVLIGTLYLWAAVCGKVSMAYWIPFFFTSGALMDLLLRGAERLMNHLALLEGIELGPPADGGAK